MDSERIVVVERGSVDQDGRGEIKRKSFGGMTDTAQLYHDHVFRHFGLPQRIISDCGPQFTAKVFQELCKKLGVKSSMSTAYYPQTDGSAE